ncbi:MAG: DUF547 domain-containing protein [Acidobacteria bacterium]|nr:DUF547 domain-containing protein [Acidobacteriota bacterium]
MRTPVWLLVLVCALAASRAEPQDLFRHEAWDRVLQQHVTPAGLVDYRALKQQPGDLERYVATLEAHSPDNAPAMFPTDAHRLAYWINAYNALIVKRVVDHYPIASIRDLGSLFSSVFGKTQIVGGKSLSYDDIEHGIIRPRFREPRIHFVLNCASRSCAPLRRHALTAETLDQTLQQAAVEFLNDPRHVRIHPDTGRIELSKYFDWFESDFAAGPRGSGGRASVLDFIRPYLAPDRQQILAARRDWRVDFLAYDWGLNDAGRDR